MLLLARLAAINHLRPKIILERKLKLTILQNPRMIEGRTILCNTKKSLLETSTIKCDVDGSFNRTVPITRTHPGTQINKLTTNKSYCTIQSGQTANYSSF